MPSLVKRSNNGGALNGSNESIRNALRSRNASVLATASPRTLGRIGGTYGLGRRGKAFFVAVMMASAQIATGQAISKGTALAVSNSADPTNTGPLAQYMGSNKTNLALAPAPAISNALDASVALIVESVKPDAFVCSFSYSNANWKKAGSATNWRGRNISAQELKKMEATVERVCESQRKQAGQTAVAVAHSAGTALATLSTSGAEQYISSQLSLAQQQLNAQTTALARAEAALNGVQRQRQTNAAAHAAALKQAQAEYEAKLQAYQNSQSWRKSLRNARTRIVEGAGRLTSAPFEALGEAGSFIVGGLKDINNSRRLAIGFIVSLVLLVTYGYIEKKTGGMVSSSILKLVKLLRNIKNMTADEASKPIAKLAKLVDAGVQTNAVNRRNASTNVVGILNVTANTLNNRRTAAAVRIQAAARGLLARRQAARRRVNATRAASLRRGPPSGRPSPSGRMASTSASNMTAAQRAARRANLARPLV